MDSLDDRKRALRALAKGRGRLPGPDVEAASGALVLRLLESGLVAGARTVALYRSLPAEVQTASLARALERTGAHVVYPVVRPGERALSFLPLAGITRKGALGVEEPAHEGPPVALSEIDLFLLPGLAGDSAGRRLGRGRGYYDTTLAAAPHALAVLLLFETGLVAEVPVGEHDVQVDAICTESRLLLCSARARARAARGERKP